MRPNQTSLRSPPPCAWIYVGIFLETHKPHTAFHHIVKALTVRFFFTNILKKPSSVTKQLFLHKEVTGRGRTSCERRRAWFLCSPSCHSSDPAGRDCESCEKLNGRHRTHGSLLRLGDRLRSPLIRLHYFYYPIGLHTRNRGTCPYLKLADTRRIC